MAHPVGKRPKWQERYVPPANPMPSPGILSELLLTVRHWESRWMIVGTRWDTGDLTNLGSTPTIVRLQQSLVP